MLSFLVTICELRDEKLLADSMLTSNPVWETTWAARIPFRAINVPKAGLPWFKRFKRCSLGLAILGVVPNSQFARGPKVRFQNDTTMSFPYV
jgi:hypothetical protein